MIHISQLMIMAYLEGTCMCDVGTDAFKLAEKGLPPPSGGQPAMGQHIHKRENTNRQKAQLCHHFRIILSIYKQD